MSSAPTGLDVREYAYGYLEYVVPDGNNHNITTRGQWLITKIQFYAAADTPASFISSLAGNEISVAAGGCLILEPNGAMRGAMNVEGQGAVLIVEYWYQARADAGSPAVVIT